MEASGTRSAGSGQPSESTFLRYNRDFRTLAISILAHILAQKFGKPMAELPQVLGAVRLGAGPERGARGGHRVGGAPRRGGPTCAGADRTRTEILSAGALRRLPGRRAGPCSTGKSAPVVGSRLYRRDSGSRPVA
jgi:hypothetical protein